MIKGRFSGRQSAGQRLAERLRPLLKRGEPALVISLPRGGVPVGLEIAKALGISHDVIVTRKISEEKRPEWSIGAVADDGSVVWSEKRKAAERPAYVKKALAAQLAIAKRRLRAMRKAIGPAVSMKGRTVILVDDGAARGWTMLSAVAEAWERGAKRVIVAVPVASRLAARRFRQVADRLVALKLPKRFYYVSSYYAKGGFSPVEDEDVSRMLKGYRQY